MSGGYLDRLAARSASVGSVLCLGLDPDPAALPPGFAPSVAGIEAFSRLVLEAALPFVAAVKPNLAYFEAFGSAGVAALERLRSLVPAGVPFVADAKRGDIGSTSARHAAAIFDVLGADATTANPYLGADALGPLLARAERFVYVLCRTSNPGAADIQDLVVADGEGSSRPAEPLHVRIARLASGWGTDGNVGLVVGATSPAGLAAVRSVAPGMAFLVPGVGAQGGEPEPVLAHGRATAPPAADRPGGGLLVNVSRGITGAAVRDTGRAGPGDPGERLAAAARSWSERLAVLR